MVAAMVSIIIPTYNRKKRLKEAIHSALQQTYNKIEVIVVDDGSTDGTGAEVKQISDKRLHYFRQKNQGAPSARNAGAKKAKGNYLVFLDDDDLLHPTKVALQLKQFATSNVPNLVAVTSHVSYERKDRGGVTKNFVQGNMYKQLLKRYAIAGTESILIKKDAFPGFDPRFQSNQEYDMMLQLAKKGTVDYVDEVLSTKRDTPGQISLNFKKKLQGTHQLWRKYWKTFLEEKVFLYNLARFTFLQCRYLLGLVLGTKVYLLLTKL